MGRINDRMTRSILKEIERRKFEKRKLLSRSKRKERTLLEEFARIGRERKKD